MDARIGEALRKLGLSEERIAAFAELLDSVIGRARKEHMVTRKAAPEALKPRRPSVRITYEGPNAPANYQGKADRTLARIKAMSTRVSAPPVVAAQDSQGVRLPPPDDAVPWLKRNWSNAQRFRQAGAHEALPGTLAALDKSRQRGRKKSK